NNLWPADDQTTTAHARENFTNALINLFPLDYVRLERSGYCAIDRRDCQPNQIRILLKSLLQPRVVTAVVERTNSSGDFESASQTGDDVAITLPVKLNLPTLF